MASRPINIFDQKYTIRPPLFYGETLETLVLRGIIALLDN